MRKKLPIIAVSLGVILSSVLMTFVQVADVFAASAIDNKYLAKDLLACYGQRLKREVIPDQVGSTGDLLSGDWNSYGWVNGPKDKTNPLGGLHTTESGKDEIGCIQLLEQLGFGISGNNSGDVLKKLGYEPQTSNGRCIELTFQTYDNETDKYYDYTNKPKLCAGSVDSNGVIQSELLGYDAPGTEGKSEVYVGFYADGSDLHLTVGMGAELMYTGTYRCGLAWLGTCYNYVQYTVGTTKWDDLVSQIDTYTKKGVETFGYFAYSYPFYYKGYREYADGTSAVSSYKMDNYINSYLVGYKNAFGKDYTTDAIQVSTQEQTVLYQNYLSQYYAVQSDACADTKDASTQAASDLGDSWVQTKVYGSDGKPKYCYIKATKHAYDGVYGINGAGVHTTGLVEDGRLSWQDLAAWLLDNGPSSINPGDVTDDIIENNPDPSDDPDDGELTPEQELEEACYQEAKSLGWVICPMIFGLQEVSKGIYQQVEPMIRVTDTVVSQIELGNRGSGPLFKSWNTFRGIANVIFVILFLFIIFSQLTGFGIDNYGIKKMLPKIIVTAILVNISFLICAVAVDVSNILGKALQDLFTSVAPSGSVLSGDIVKGTLATVDKSVDIIRLARNAGLASAGFGVLAVAMNGWAVIIPILLFLITMVISVIFALIVLGLRQAFVVILIVVSPIAFACTLLPNTEPVFKKWKEFFKQILMVYPIVGGLIGAGYFVARMIFTNEADLIMSITAGMLCVAPYFLVPSLTRKSLAMAGNIGERLAGAGRAARNAGRRINNSEAVRNARARSRDGATAFGRNGLNALTMKAANWANTEGKGKGTKRAAFLNHTIASRGRLASVARTNQNRVANSRQTAYGQASNAVSERSRLESGGYDARNAAIAGESFNKAVKDYESLITNGEYIGSDGQKIGQNDLDKLAAELTREMLKENADEVKIRALTNRMLGNGKKGLRKVDSAYAQALAGGPDGRTPSAAAIRGFSDNIKNSHPEIADMMPSLFESSLVGAPNGSLGGRAYEQFNNEGIGSLNAAKMAKLDKTQLDKYLNANGTGFASYMNDTSRQQLSELAAQALSDERIAGDISVDNRSRLEAIARAGGQPVAVSKMEGDSGKIHQAETVIPAQTEAAQAAVANAATVNAEAAVEAARARADNGRHALDEYTESVIRRVESGDIKADDGERMIQHAEEHIRNKYGNGGKA